MKRAVVFILAVAFLQGAEPVRGAEGENWEIVTGGMPGMPEMVMNVCIEKGSERDPGKLVQKDDNCEVIDVKSSGSKTSWKMRCNKNGDDMTGTGEVRYKNNSFQGTVRMQGTSGGEKVDMTTSYKGRKIGTPCDPSAPTASTVKGMENLNDLMGLTKSHMESAMAEQCEVSNYHATELISSRFFGAKAACSGKEKHACKVISKEVARSPEVYAKLAKHDDTSDVLIADICKIDMKAAAKSICKKVDSSNYRELEEACPEEAKAFIPEPSTSSRTGSPSEPATTVIDNAIKLKGLFGF